MHLLYEKLMHLNLHVTIEHKDTKKQSTFAILEDTESSKAAFYKGHKDG